MRGIVLEDNIVLAIRMVSIGLTIISTIKITQYSLTLFFVTIVSFYYLKKKSRYDSELKRDAKLADGKNKKKLITNQDGAEITVEEIENPYKKFKKLEYSQLPEDVLQKAKNDLFNHFIYDYSYAKSLEAFQLIKSKTECIFAKKSNLWGAPAWSADLPADDNINACIPSFILFCNFCTHLQLDGYLIELPGWLYGDDLNVFARIFCRILKKFSDADPDQRKCMDSDFIDRKNWVFEFSKITFFITTFAPCYSENHPRYTFGVKNCYILFQPEVSFALHDLPNDTPNTQWDNPVTVRDKIRVAFKNAGRGYHIRNTIYYPMAYDMIRPLNNESSNENEIIKWWLHKNDAEI